jgi:hypothetical protein
LVAEYISLPLLAARLNSSTTQYFCPSWKNMVGCGAKLKVIGIIVDAALTTGRLLRLNTPEVRIRSLS